MTNGECMYCRDAAYLAEVGGELVGYCITGCGRTWRLSEAYGW